ncbi:MAG: helix-turn-helix domain-containing protein [Phycisphaerales bacterium]
MINAENVKLENTGNNNSKIQLALLTISNVCALMNISKGEFYNLRSTGKFAPLPVSLCRKVLYLRAEIEAWIAAKCPHRKQWLALNQFKDPRRHC